MLFLEVDIALRGTTLLVVCIVLLLLVLGLIFMMRSRFSGFASKDHTDTVNKTLLGSRTKYPQVNALKNFRTPLTLLGSVSYTHLTLPTTPYV